MKIVQINTTCGVGSTGKICVGISRLLTENGIENYIIYSSKSDGYELGIRCSNDAQIKLQAMKSRICGNYGFNSKKSTRKIIAELERINPDIVHLHNIHSHDCNLEMLFTYLKRREIKIIWTFHDCWAFTAYCPHFTMAKCDKWKMNCAQCIQRKDYSWFFDRSSYLYAKKKELFQGLNLTIVTPSKWLADLVKQSFLKDYDVDIINNGIDLGVFKPVKSTFRTKYNLTDKKVLLGISYDWSIKKGLDVFLELSKKLSDEYKIVLVGTNDEMEKKLPKNILSIHRTQSQSQLAEIYSAVDIFVNPTREDTFPTVNIEAIACGTPVITFRTGGSPEILDETCGSIIECDDIDAFEKEILHICMLDIYRKEDCVKKAADYEQKERFKEYIDLYERIDIAGIKGS